ncbi:hypothetical protein [Pseudomonas sp.]|uniref:hypothetical protein n=1 Tax=Pseudomonas sp. TaxID=306 RepID=UPI00356A16DB
MSSDIAHIIRSERIISGLVNAAINGGLAWYLFKTKPLLLLWGSEGFGVDLMATAFIMLFIVALIVVPIFRRKVRQGTISATWDNDRWLHRQLQRFPHSLLGSAILFGLIGMVVFVPPSLLVLSVSHITELSPAQYAIFKGCWAGSLAAVMVGSMIRLAVSRR